MLMFFVALFFSLFGLAILSIPFWLAIFPEQEPEFAEAREAKKQPVAELVPSHFFGESILVPLTAQPRVPLEALLLQIENHIRLEQAAAESYVEAPGLALLHSRTRSPLVH
ncbi:MAG TPA: hypothetical protein VN428_05995 [Bryobacteraceae bacterium]|nr:hypothetical protein [Bryobacteraceae bacterium]